MKKSKSVEEYIKNSPKEIQAKLRQLRTIILSIVPKETEEKISYGMPFYSYLDRLVYFAAQKNFIGLYIPPPVITDHAKELVGYVTTKSAVHFLNNTPLPVALIKKLIKARIQHNQKGSA